MTLCHVSSGSCWLGALHQPLLFSDNTGKSPPDANICNFKCLFTGFSLAVIRFDCCCTLEGSAGESVVYEPGGDHLG